MPREIRFGDRAQPDSLLVGTFIPVRRTLSRGKNAGCFRLAAIARRDWKRALVGGKRAGRNLACAYGRGLSMPLTQSASPNQLYFPPPNRAIGNAAPVPKMRQNLQKIRLHQIGRFAAI